MLPAIAWSMSESLGFGVAASRAAACMIWPVWQYPHWGTLWACQARCTGCEPSLLKPSMVTTLRPSAADTGVTQARTAWPSKWTVHAPHAETPQANLVPVSPSSSRRYHSNGMAPSPLNSCRLLFTVTLIMEGLRIDFADDSAIWHLVCTAQAENSGGARGRSGATGSCHGMLTDPEPEHCHAVPPPSVAGHPAPVVRSRRPQETAR